MDTKETKDVSSQSDASFDIYDCKTWDCKDKMSIEKKYEVLLQKATDSKKEADLYYNQNWFLSTLDYTTIHDFLIAHPEFYTEKGMSIACVIHALSIETQKKIAETLEDFNLQPEELTEVVLALRKEAKKDLDASLIPEEYRYLLGMEAYLSSNRKNIKIKVDFDKDLEEYRGLDKWIKLMPQHLTEEERKRIPELYKICPGLSVQNIGDIFYSTGAEYLEGEKWIESLIESIPPELSDIQKLAIIDNAIGKKISYSPDHDTEIANTNNERAFWKIISSGKGVCLGIADVEKEILSRVGIKSSIILSDEHAFLKVNDIDIPRADGSVVRGDTIVDPTWNLSSHKFGLKPLTFGITYEQARELDVDFNGIDTCAHKYSQEGRPGAEKVRNSTIGLDDQSLRRVFASVGLARENGEFPAIIYDELFKTAGRMYESNPDTYFQKIFKIITRIYPDFTEAQNESIGFISSVLIKTQNENIERAIVDRVYDKSDKSKSPVLYTYADMGELGERFYVADREQGNMIAISKEEFEERFDCYDLDLKAKNGVRPWQARSKEYQNPNISQAEKGNSNTNTASSPNNATKEIESEEEER